MVTGIVYHPDARVQIEVRAVDRVSCAGMDLDHDPPLSPGSGSHAALAPVSSLPAVWRALRPHQWLKNVLVAVPLAASHRLTDRAAVVATLLGGACFCLVASAGYVLNDLADAKSDHRHPRKSRRPFASGELPRAYGFLLVLVLLAAGGGVASRLPAGFGLILAGYFAAAIGYTFLLRRVPMLDVILLAGMYTARVFAGGFAAGIAVSEWLASFSMFLFLSLAFLKRAAELEEAPDAMQDRGYSPRDRQVLFAFGAASGIVSVVVLTLYLSSQEVGRLYSHPGRLWAICPLVLSWIAHLWMQAGRGAVRDDPLIVALSDRTSWIVGALGAILVFISI
jgi:4-hydroxybenzoate polyprenyltransferase